MQCIRERVLVNFYVVHRLYSLQLISIIITTPSAAKNSKKKNNLMWLPHWKQTLHFLTPPRWKVHLFANSHNVMFGVFNWEVTTCAGAWRKKIFIDIYFFFLLLQYLHFYSISKALFIRMTYCIQKLNWGKKLNSGSTLAIKHSIPDSFSYT